MLSTDIFRRIIGNIKIIKIAYNNIGESWCKVVKFGKSWWEGSKRLVKVV